MSDSDTTVAPLSPSMFLQEINEVGTADLDHVDREHLKNRLRYLYKLKEDLRKRFRNEFLGVLIQRSSQKGVTADLKVSEIVLVGNDIKKRLYWPLKRVIKRIAGKDMVCRVVNLQTKRDNILRLIQRGYRLEVCDDESEFQDKNPSENDDTH